MATTIYTLGTTLIRAAPRPRVYVRQRWNSEWIYLEDLRCAKIRQVAAPEVSEITLTWRFGPGKQPSASVFGLIPELSLLGWFVKVEVDAVLPLGVVQTFRYFGVIWEEDNDRFGRQKKDGVWQLSGRQSYLAFGLEWLYRRQRVDRALFLARDGISIKEIRRALEFNAANPYLANEQDTTKGNRTPTSPTSAIYLFTEDLANGKPWSTREIVRYLHYVYAPLGSNEFDAMGWQLDPEFLKFLPDDDRPQLAPQGRELGSVLDELLDRRRGLGWYVAMDHGANRPLVRPFSLAGQLVSLPGGGTLEPNDAQYILYSDRAVEAGTLFLKRSLSANFDEVIVRGERIRSCFTVSFADGTLVADWTSTQRAAYNAAASALAGYSGLGTDQREAWNARARGREDLSRVFSCFRLPDALTQVKDGLGGTAFHWLPNEEETGAEIVYRPECKLLNHLPLRDTTEATLAKQFLRPLVLVKVKTGDNPRYHAVDRLSDFAAIEGLGQGDGFHWSGHVRMAEHDAAIWVEISGKARHMLAKAAADFTPLSDGADDRVLPEIDWRTDLIATVAMEAQRHVEAHWPEDLGATDVDVLRRLVIDIGEKGRLDYMPQGTVEGVTEDGKLVHRTGSLYVRDDRTRMRDLARRAFEWYRRIRQAVRFPIQGYFPLVPLGGYVEQIGDPNGAETIAAGVTGVEFDFVNSVTTLSTDYADLDFRPP